MNGVIWLHNQNHWSLAWTTKKWRHSHRKRKSMMKKNGRHSRRPCKRMHLERRVDLNSRWIRFTNAEKKATMKATIGVTQTTPQVIDNNNRIGNEKCSLTYQQERLYTNNPNNQWLVVKNAIPCFWGMQACNQEWRRARWGHIVAVRLGVSTVTKRSIGLLTLAGTHR